MLDLSQGYWQVKMAEFCKKYKTFVTRFGTFSFEVTPFGLINTPETFQMMMDHFFEDLLFARAFLDDVIIHSTTMKYHLEHLCSVLDLLQRSELNTRI